MGTNPISPEEMQELRKSYRDSSDLLLGIYENIKLWREHNIQAYSEAAHRGFLELKKNIDDIIPMRLHNYQSPPKVKLRKRAANWRTPENIPSPRRIRSISNLNGHNSNTNNNNNNNNSNRGSKNTRRNNRNNNGGTLPYNNDL
jgi:hypothetical protein